MYLLYVSNKKNERFLSDKERYRKIPLHPFIIGLAEKHIIRNNKTPNSLLFSRDNSKKEAERLSSKFAASAIDYLFIALYIKNQIWERNKDASKTIDDFRGVLKSAEKMEAIREMTKKNNYHFYSFRHTIITILTLEKTNLDFVDYVTGHKNSTVRDNYTHINTVNTELFCREYGKLYLDMVEKYFFPPRKTREEQKAEQEKTLREYIASRKKDRDSAGHEDGKDKDSIFESI
jgi:hypothetical protein